MMLEIFSRNFGTGLVGFPDVAHHAAAIAAAVRH
jgi:hypothetical protein